MKENLGWMACVLGCIWTVGSFGLLFSHTSLGMIGLLSGILVLTNGLRNLGIEISNKYQDLQH